MEKSNNELSESSNELERASKRLSDSSNIQAASLEETAADALPAEIINASVAKCSK